MTASNTNLITKEVLNCLEKLLNELRISDYTIDISLGCEFGENYGGIIAKAHVSGNDEKNQATSMTFIIKCAPYNEKFRSLYPVIQSFYREDYIYRTVLPEFIELQNEKRILNPFSSIATFYKSTMEYMNEAIILDDMKQHGFRTFGRKKSLDFNHTLLVLKEYGKLHALSFALHDQKSEIFKELSNNTPDAYFSGKNGASFLESVQPQGLRALRAIDEIKEKEIYNKFKTFQENMTYIFLETLKPEAAGNYAVICHGDCWMNNMLFKYDDYEKPQIPTKLCLLDWQLSRCGSPVLDLSYFLFTCTDKELRDKHYDELIEEYYKSFCIHLRELGSDPDMLFPYKILQEHLKKFSVYGLFMTIIVLFLMTSEVDEIPDIHNASDLDNMTEILKFESKNVEIYNARIKDVILDFVRFGYEM